ncbi:unnamed protein product, partial [Candidula unifasciata]
MSKQLLHKFPERLCKDSHVCKENHCNGRVGYPAVEHPLSEWSFERNNDGCSVKGKDIASSPPTVFADADDKMLIVNGSSDGLAPCFSQRNSTIDGAFTLIFWLMADCRNCSVLSVLVKGKQTVQIRIIEGSISVGNTNQQQPNIGKQWIMIGLRSVNNQVTVFISDQPIKLENSAEIVNIYIGSEDVAPITDIFRMYSVSYYRDALTNREIQAKRVGITDPTIQYEDCQCPIDHFEEVGDNNCTDGTSYIQRFIPELFYNASVTVDGDHNTYWASSDQGDAVLILNFNISFQIETIRVFFNSKLPQQVSFFLFSEGQQKSSGDFL